MKMLKNALFIMGLSGCALLAACSGSAPETAGADTEPAAAKEEAKTVYNQDETVKYEDVEYKILSVEKSSGSEYDKPKEGMEYVIVKVEIKNNSDAKISYNPFDWKMENSKGQETDGTFTTIDSDTALNSGDLKPGGSVEGTLAFEEPAGDEGLALNYYANMLFDEDPVFSIKLNK